MAIIAKMSKRMSLLVAAQTTLKQAGVSRAITNPSSVL
jgi:hypothetical protein